MFEEDKGGRTIFFDIQLECTVYLATSAEQPEESFIGQCSQGQGQAAWLASGHFMLSCMTGSISCLYTVQKVGTTLCMSAGLPIMCQALDTGIVMNMCVVSYVYHVYGTT